MPLSIPDLERKIDEQQVLLSGLEDDLRLENDRIHEAIGHQEGGRLLAYCGDWAGAAAKLDMALARELAQKGREYAWCDGPPYAYQVALDEAERLLAELGEEN